MKNDTKMIFVITGTAIVLYLMKHTKSSLQGVGYVRPTNTSHGPQISPSYSVNPMVQSHHYGYQNYKNYLPRAPSGTPFSRFSFGHLPSIIDYGRPQTAPTRKSTHTPFTAAQAAAFAAQERAFGIPVVAIGTSVMPTNSVI